MPVSHALSIIGLRDGCNEIACEGFRGRIACLVNPMSGSAIEIHDLPAVEMSMYCCPVCDCGPMSMAHMYQHLRRAHNWTDEQIREEEMSIKEKKLSEQRQYKCESCDRTFYNDQSWRLHWKRAHGGMKRISGLYVVCPGCQQKFSDNAELVKHWREEHEQDADQSVDPNFVLATLNRTLRELDTLKRRKRPELSNPGWRWRSKKKNSEEPQVQEPDNQKEDRDTPDDILFDTIVKQEEPGPSRDLDQGTSKVEMVNKDQTESLGENVSKKTEQKQKTSGKRRANETPEQRAERRRFKAERERFRRWQMKARREKEREVISHVRQVMEIVPQKPEGSSRNYHLAGGDITQAVKVQASQRGSITPLSKGKSKCFALVGIKSEEERQRFLDLAVSNGFYDVMFLNDPLGKSLSDAKDSKQHTEPNKRVTPPPQKCLSKYGNVKATTEKEVDDQPQTSFANVDNGVSKLSATVVKDESVTNEDQPELPFNREDRESSCSSQSSEIGQVSTTKRNGDAVQRPRNRCLVCGLHGHPDETRISSRRRQQNVILFSCLLAQNIITKKEAYEMNNETQKSHTLICHDHYIQAADYLGKRVELLCGKFPEKGLYLIASEVKDDLLSLVLDHAKSLDADTVVHVGDLSRFFHDCLMNYYSKDGWSLQEKNPTSPDEKQEEGQKQTTTMEQPSTSSRQSPPIIKNPNAEVKPCSSVGLPSAIKVDAAKEDESAQLEPKKEIGEDICEISAMDLLEPSVPDEASTSPVIVINSTSDESKASVPKSPQKVSQKGYEANRSPVNNGMITVPFMVEPRDQSTLVDSLTGDDFWNHFRITRPTFAKLCCSLNELVNKKGEQAIRCPIDVKIATTLEVLAGITRSSVGFKAAEVALIFTEVLAALAEWSATMVQWPDERERKRISQNFFELTGLKNVVGCIDGTIIRGTQGLNVGVVADDRKRFRWVFAKFHSNEDDDSVFKQSLLCQQLRDGRRKGILIGDDAYKSESFLLTPEGKDWMTEEDFALANTVRRAHLMVQEAITAWKRQFPILNGTIRSARIARIVVCCAALYNLSRVENEPVFEGEDEIVIDDTEEQCLTISE